MKKLYISPETIVMQTALSAFCTGMSTGTDDNTGGSENGPGKGDDNEDAGAKKYTYSVWEDEL